MNQTVLVTYASRTGTTAGIAEEIGVVLSEHGLPTEVREMKQVQSILSYSAIVAGSAIQGGAWLPEAMHFMEKYQGELRKKPFAAFLVCMTLAMPNTDHHRHVADWLEPVRTRVPTISEGLFAGNLDITKIPSWKDRMMFRVSVRMGVWSEADHRDWDKVRMWASSLVNIL